MPDYDDARRKRLRYRSRYTGCKETDAWLGAFADQHLGSLSEAHLAQYERLLQQPDGVVYAWLSGRGPVPMALDNELEQLLRRTKITA